MKFIIASIITIYSQKRNCLKVNNYFLKKLYLKFIKFLIHKLYLTHELIFCRHIYHIILSIRYNVIKDDQHWIITIFHTNIYYIIIQ